MHIVQATERHWQILSNLATATWIENFGHLQTADELASLVASKYNEEQMRLELRTELTYFVCDDEDLEAERPVGFCMIKPNSRNSYLPELPDPCWELHRFYLTSGAQGKGAGTKLLELVMQKVHEGGARSLWLWVLYDNERARAFYEKHGIKYSGIMVKSIFERDCLHYWTK